MFVKLDKSKYRVLSSNTINANAPFEDRCIDNGYPFSSSSMLYNPLQRCTLPSSVATNTDVPALFTVTVLIDLNWHGNLRSQSFLSH